MPIENSTSPKAAIVTLGCPMNQVDSERIMSGLVSLGFEITPEEEADVVIVNTCGFIDDAREESVETIMSVADLKKGGNVKSLVVAGCLAERYREELESEMTEADAIVGLSDRENIPGLCLELLNRSRPGDESYTRVISGPMHTAYLKIAEGCDNRCTYCAIPMIRGKFRSIDEDSIIAEARELASLNVRELILIAQDTTYYGADLDGKTMPALLRRLSDVDNIDWIRLLYAHPARFTDELVDTMADLPAVLPYIDMPLQHISPRILKSMARYVSADRVDELIARLRDKIDGVVLRTSLMVGFPGETDEDFQQLLDFVGRARFERLGTFIYSPEEGTKAADMSDAVPIEVAEERYDALMEVQSGISEDFHRSLVGREFDMIVDSVDPDEGTVTGRTYMDTPDIDGSITAKGQVEDGQAFCRIRITGAESYDMTGEIVG